MQARLPLTREQRAKLVKEHGMLPRKADGQVVHGYLSALANKWGVSLSTVAKLAKKHERMAV